MELHKAAELYPQHRETMLRAAPNYYVNAEYGADVVWNVCRATGFKSNGDDYQGYSLMLSLPCIQPDAMSFSELQKLKLRKGSPEYDYAIEATYITKQRGGKRVFKSLEAVVSALRQIGQDHLIFNFDLDDEEL